MEQIRCFGNVRQKSKRNSLRFCEKWDDKLFIVVIINAIVIVVIIIVVVGCNAAAANRTIKRSVVVAVQARPLLFTQLCAHLMHPLRTAVALDHGFVAGVLHAMRLFAHRARAFYCLLISMCLQKIDYLHVRDMLKAQREVKFC